MASINEINPSEIQLNVASSLSYERKIWQLYILKVFMVLPSICDLCRLKGINIYENETLLNPYIGRCINNKCRKIYYLRNNTFFSIFPKTNISTILYIMKLWIIEKRNANQIYDNIKALGPNITISKDKIRKLLEMLRHYIAHYIKDTYVIEDISIHNGFEHFAVVESDFVKINGQILWVIGIINTHNKLLRLELSFNRNTEVMKKIIYTHVQTGNIIVSDGWAAYSWLDNNHSGFIHSVHNHGAGDFGNNLDSTSHIESVWNQLKSYIKSIYNIIPSDKFVLYIKEAEFRRIINNFDNNKKMGELFSILNYLRDIGINNLYSLDKLNEITEK